MNVVVMEFVEPPARLEFVEPLAEVQGLILHYQRSPRSPQLVEVVPLSHVDVSYFSVAGCRLVVQSCKSEGSRVFLI